MVLLKSFPVGVFCVLAHCFNFITIKCQTIHNFAMESSEDEMEVDDTEWKQHLTDSHLTCRVSVSGPSLSKRPTPAHRVILHFDLDCFYAQVEMIRNPALRDVPLGIQQKYIVVTCNYVARQQGVTKLMSVTDAKQKCPQLVLVKGEDLTHYRVMSYQVTDLLLSFCPLVERLGFDENFVDITEIIQKRLTCTPVSSFKGYVYSTSKAAEIKASFHPELALGSHVAAELREAIRDRLGLTSCAGVATSKLLAKLVSGTFKPNQQTTLLPENVDHIMGSLGGLRKIPGVGHQTAKRLQALGLVSVSDLQLFPLTALIRELGSPCAAHLKNLSLGVDDSPVNPTGAPQSLSDEDSFKKMSCVKEVMDKIQQLLGSLVERMRKDGRQPQTFRLSVRKYSASNKWCSRESRQCPIPNHVGHKITSASSDDASAQLLSLAMKLFSKMVDTAAPFHLTLINVCFSNLQSRAPAASTRGSITSFFAPSACPQNPSQSPVAHSNIDSSTSVNGAEDRLCSLSVMSPLPPENAAKSPIVRDAASPKAGPTQSTSSVPADASRPVTASRSSTCSDGGDADITATYRLPPNVDPQVFSQLPANLQTELIREWEQRRPIPKIPILSRKPGREAKDKKGTRRRSQANSLLDYFKPA
ncbi:DNA polymerase iota isoform X2 [Hippocampus comes]|uniref:DNA polymerase iota isoform X2 n=1 Tax=Hippocampus comes TaxID=109280 RepID=UPI00094EC273|nr:PREDICTED: DNA polymerase iota isoform X2 [Hippocampus comes]